MNLSIIYFLNKCSNSYNSSELAHECTSEQIILFDHRFSSIIGGNVMVILW